MRTTAQLRQAWAPPCTAPTVVRDLVPGIRISIDPRAMEAFSALGCVIQAHEYHVRREDTGAYNCRTITGGSGHSLHSYGIATDVNWNSNPYRADNRLVTDMPPEMVADVRQIRTQGGHPVFRWGGDYRSVKDAMHFEVVASPAELAEGIDWDTVRQPERDPTKPTTWPTLHRGDRGPSVLQLQFLLSIEVDGIFGPATESAVRRYQEQHGLTADGIVGLQFWTALLTDQPKVAPGEPGPVKGQHRPEVPASEVDVQGDEPDEGGYRDPTELGADPLPIDPVAVLRRAAERPTPDEPSLLERAGDLLGPVLAGLWRLMAARIRARLEEETDEALDEVLGDRAA